MSQCTAKSKRSGARCKGQAVTGRTTCRMHGGTGAVGALSPAWRGKGRGKHIPDRLREDFLASLNNPERLALTEDLALIDARHGELIRRLDTGESGSLWRELQEADRSLSAAFAEARRTGDMADVARALSGISALITRGAADAVVWSEILNLIERRRKLVESEQKREIAMQQMVSAAEAMALVSALTEAVREHVRDPDVLSAISAAVVRLVGRADQLDARAAGSLAHP